MPFILAPFVVPNLPLMAAQFPRLSFRLNMSDRLVRLGDESYDVAIRMGELGDSSFVSRVLRKTRWVTVAAPSYLARHGVPREPADLETRNCLRFVGPNGRARDFVFREGSRTSERHVTGNLLIDHGVHLLAAAEAGLGLCQVLDFMAEGPEQEGRVVEVLGPYSSAGPTIRALTTQARARSANARTVIKFLVEWFRALPR